MTSVQRYLSGHINAVRDAGIIASSVRASTAIERSAATREGGGQIRLEGQYTGHEDATVDIDITSAAGGIPRASVPTFSGVGNGGMTIVSVDAAAPLQTLTFTLTDLGITTQAAQLTVREALIRARAPGTSGNDIFITVEPNFTRAGTQWALLSDWPAGTALQRGDQWHFGGLPLTNAGELDAASPRIQFGDDPQIYRPYRMYKDGAWQHGVSPALVRDIPADTRVYDVAGGYTITVSDGVTVEMYTDVVTFFDFLIAIEASALVEVASVIAADRTPGGQAAIDVPLRTAAWISAISGVSLEDVSIPAAAPTQKLIVRCINADVIGRERWSVNGSVSGELPVADTGIPYVSAAANFTVPVIVSTIAPTGAWSFKYEPVTRSEGAGLPSVCIRPFRFGINAVPRTVTFRYQLRPPPDCKCSDMPTPVLSMDCLGVYDEDEEVSDMDEKLRERLIRLFAYRREFIASQIALNSAGRGTIQQPDIDLIESCSVPLYDTVKQIFEDDDALAAWDECFDLFKDDMDIYFGQGSNAAIWHEFVGGSIGQLLYNPHNHGRYRLSAITKDGTAVEISPGFREILASDDRWTMDPKTDIPFTFNLFSGQGEPVTTEQGGNIGRVLYNFQNGHYYRLVAGRINGNSVNIMPVLQENAIYGLYAEPWASNAWTTDSSTFTLHRTVISLISSDTYEYDFEDLGTSYSPDMPVKQTWVLTYHYEGIGYPRGGGLFEGVTVILGDHQNGGVSNDIVIKYRSMMDYVLTVAGIDPKPDASNDAGGCWRDYPDETHWWADTSGYYLPAFTNKPYHSARRDTETGIPYTTQEFGFGLVVACPERLLPGDTITIVIESVDGERPYQVGDEAVIETIAAGPAYLTGGVDGTDELTWRVAGTVSANLPDYIVPLASAVPDYTAAGFTLRIAPGGIPFALGDVFSFAVEAGQFRWRSNGGTWSVPADIPADGIAALPDGLQANFLAGAAPSFVVGDIYTFAVYQPYAVSHVRDAHADAWGWAGDAATLDIDFGSAIPVAAIAIARYDLPAGAVVTAELSLDNVSWTPYALDVSRQVAV